MKNVKKKLLAVMAGVFLIAAILLLIFALQEELKPQKEQKAMEELADSYVEQPSSENPDEESDELLTGVTIDFVGLKNINADIMAWILIPGTQVDYPVLQHASDDDYYLHHSFEKEESVSGSIYIYSNFDAGFTEPHTILFGHNMASGSMFGDLSEYKDEQFLEAHPWVYLYLPDGAVRYRIYSAYSCPVFDRTYQTGFDYGTKDYMRWIDHTKQMSLWKSERDPSGDDAVLTLSTCTDDRDAFRRFVLHCFAEETAERADHTENEKEETNDKTK